MHSILKIAFWSMLLLGIVIAGLRLTVLDWWTIPSDDQAMAVSLAPSLAAGDKVLLWRKKPGFGDLLRCDDPDAPGRFVIGRVLAESRDSLEFHGYEVIVNGKESKQESVCTDPIFRVSPPGTEAPIELVCGIEVVQGYKHPRAIKPSDNPSANRPRDGHKTIKVEEGKVFLVSDNRAFPMDSRDYGALSLDTCQAAIFFRIVGSRGFQDIKTRLSYIPLTRCSSAKATARRQGRRVRRTKVRRSEPNEACEL